MTSYKCCFVCRSDSSRLILLVASTISIFSINPLEIAPNIMHNMTDLETSVINSIDLEPKYVVELPLE